MCAWMESAGEGFASKAWPRGNQLACPGGTRREMRRCGQGRRRRVSTGFAERIGSGGETGGAGWFWSAVSAFVMASAGPSEKTALTARTSTTGAGGTARRAGARSGAPGARGCTGQGTFD